MKLQFKMGDTSGPQRVEMLKSNVGGMKVVFSHIRTQIERMMGMMRQLLQAKSASPAAPARETQTMTVTAPEGHRAKKRLLAQ